LVGLSFTRPESPLAYVEECIKKIRKEKLLMGNSKEMVLKWNTFLPALNSIQSPRSTVGPSNAELVPPLHPYIHSTGKPVLPLAKNYEILPAIGSVSQLASQNILFVVGGPGTNRTNHVKRLAKDFGYHHIAVEDIVREESKKDTPRAAEIARIISEKKVLPAVLYT
jgi:hypothetical protein